MDTTVLQPGAGQTVVATTDHHNQHHNDHHGFRGFDTVESRADFRALTNEVERFGTVNGDRIRDTAAAGALAACRTDGIVQSGFGATSDRICHAAKDTALAACKTDDAIAEAKLSTAVGFKDAIIAANVGFSAATVQLSTAASAAQLEAAKNAAALSVEATRNYNALQVEATRNFYALSVEAVKNASAAELRAQQIAASAAAKAAECCCELKALITSDGNATRALINTNTIESLRSQLVATQRLIPVTIPVGAG